MKYILKKDLPTFRAGDEFHLSPRGNLVHTESHVVAYMQHTLKKFPNILTNWFEEIPDQPKTVWDLKKGDECWSRTATSSCLGDSTPVVATRETWHGDVHQLSLREMGGVFLTVEDCNKDIAWQKAREILLRDTKGFKPNWKDLGQEKYRVAYNASSDALFVEWQLDGVHSCIHFATKEDTEASIKVHEKEWKIYLGVEE